MEADSNEDPDAELLASIGRGEEYAFRLLITRKLPQIHGLALRMLGDAGKADDVAQEAFLRVWRQASTWRTGEACFDTWLYRVVLNLCTDHLRRRREIPVAEPPEQIDPTMGADRQMARDETVQGVKAALARLPARQKESLMLHMYQELSNIQISDVMGITVEALESLLSRARRTLRAQLEGMDV